MDVLAFIEAVKSGSLPSDFNEWDRNDAHGNSFAHIAAAFGMIPPHETWEKRTKNGRTVAHEMAVTGIILYTEGFTGWEWADNDGDTVAHCLVRNGFKLPNTFTNFGLKDKRGYSVAHTAMWLGTYTKEELNDWMKLEDNNKRTVEAEGKFFGNL